MLPDYAIDLSWSAGSGDLDLHYLVAIGESGAPTWTINYIGRGSLDAAPYTRLERDAREGGDPERIVGRRWYDGVSEVWVHDYEGRSTASLRTTGARVDLLINEEAWSFAVADAPFDSASSDSSGWWHVCDLVVTGSAVAVDTVQAFQPAP